MAEQPRRGDVPGIQIHVVRRFAASRSTVWQALSSAEGLQQWFADRAQVDLGEGGGLRLETLREDAGPVVEMATTTSLDPGRMWILEFRRDDPQWHGTTVLELILEDDDTGCRLEVFHEGFQRQALSACMTIWEEYRRRWWDGLSRLQDVVTAPSAP